LHPWDNMAAEVRRDPDAAVTEPYPARNIRGPIKQERIRDPAR